MSSNHNNRSSSSLSAPGYLAFNTDPSVVPYLIIPKLQQDGTIGQGRPCEICLNVIGLGANGALHSYNMHIQAY